MSGNRGLDPGQYARRRFQSLTREFEWDASCDSSWTDSLRARVRSVIGLPNEPRVPVDPVVEAVETFEDHVRETVTYQTRDGLRAFGYLLIPRVLTGPSPAVICVPGHGKGVDALVGLAPDDYQHSFALQCVRRGLMTLAIESASFGHRKSAGVGDRDSSCHPDSMAALMLGESMIGWRTHDATVAIDFLQSRAEVDPARIGIVGISGGGTVALWTACLDARIRAAVVSGYFNTFYDSILSIEHCVDNYAPGLAKLVQMPDLVSLIAPRCLFVESGSDDDIFPAAAFRQACSRSAEIYEWAGAIDRFGSDLFPGGHFFSGRKSLPVLAEWLREG